MDSQIQAHLVTAAVVLASVVLGAILGWAAGRNS